MRPSRKSNPHSGHKADDLFTLVYEELKRQAHRQRVDWGGDTTLNTTAIVNEAYLKLALDRSFDDTRHFLRVAGKAMRQLLIDHARLRLAKKRGGNRRRVSLSESRLGSTGRFELTPEKAEELIDLDEALHRLRERSGRQADVVDCRFFAGLTIAETADALGTSPATVKRDWANAQLWLYRCLADDSADPGDPVS